MHVFLMIYCCLAVSLYGSLSLSSKFAYPKELYPPSGIQKNVKRIFTDEFINLITNIDDVPDLDELLEEKDFKVLQYKPNSPKHIVVVEHPLIPGYVLKFSRTPDIAIMYLTKKDQAPRRWSDLRLRVENARKLRDLIAQNGITFIKIPQKYLMYVKKFPIVIAKKINIPRRKPLRTMNSEQINELLFLVKKSNGILDLSSRNIIFDGKYVYFIDTERVEQPSPEKLKAILRVSTKEFKMSVNPKYIPCINEWYTHLDNPSYKEVVCVSYNRK